MARWRIVVLEIVGRLGLLLANGFFLWSMARHFAAKGTVSDIALMIEEAIILALVLIRKPTDSFTTRFHEWVVAIASALAPTFLRPAGTSDDWLALTVQIAGTAIATAGLLSLNRSFGIVPANRGVKTGGMYRFVRHPIYFGYLVSYAGYFTNHPSVHNFVTIVASTALFVLRILMEEGHLKQSADYQALCQRTRWRLVSHIW